MIKTPHQYFHRLALVALTTFLLTFIVSRIIVILIMARMVPDLFLYVGQTHVHHLNYGIFTLSLVAGILLFIQVNARVRLWCAVGYGFSMALTFDEFGMWMHLGGSYWQRASFDAIIVILGLLGIIAFAPPIARIRTHQWILGGTVIAMTALFYTFLFKSLDYASEEVGPKLLQLEKNGPH